MKPQKTKEIRLRKAIKDCEILLPIIVELAKAEERQQTAKEMLDKKKKQVEWLKNRECMNKRLCGKISDGVGSNKIWRCRFCQSVNEAFEDETKK